MCELSKTEIMLCNTFAPKGKLLGVFLLTERPKPQRPSSHDVMQLTRVPRDHVLSGLFCARVLMNLSLLSIIGVASYFCGTHNSRNVQRI